MASIIKLDNINAYYDEAHILNDVSLQIERGEVVCLIGRNGVGKTTTLKSIMGLVKVKKGMIYYEEKDITNLKAYDIFKSTRIGYVPEERRIFTSLSVRENLLIGTLSTKSTGDWDLEKVFDLFPVLREKQQRSGGFLSGGEQQMLAIGRSLMSNPDLVLLDEPCEGLAPIIVQELVEAIKKLHQSGITILLVEQSLTISKALGQKFYVMSKGQIQHSCNRTEFFNDKEIIEKYMGVGI